MKKYFHSIRARILLCTISIILLISVIIILVSFFIVSSNLRENLIQTSETRLSFLCSSIDSNINNVNSLLYSCKQSRQIRKFTMEENPSDNRAKIDAHDYITELYNANTALSSQIIRLVILGTAREDIIQIVEPPYSSTAVSAKSVLSLPYFDTLLEHPQCITSQIVPDPFYTTKSVPMIPIVTTIEHPYQPENTGYVFAEMSVSVITDPIRNYAADSDSLLYIRIGGHLYQYENQTLLPSQDTFSILRHISGISLRGDTIIQKVYSRQTGDTYIMVTHPLANEGISVVECIREDILLKEIFHTLLPIVVIILTSAALIGIMLSLFLFRTVNVPVRKLQERMQRIAEGDFSRDPSTEWPHELGEIGRNINDLSENVLSLMNQRLENERQKRDYEYRMLQSQINPHFLYNTLNSIKWMATIQNAPGIAEMTTSLSRLLKDISKGTTNLVPLSHEIALLNDYFTIQQYRYGGNISLNYDIADDSLTACLILKFTLQPIVENAIFHGIEPKGCPGTVRIKIYQDENTDVHIDITDDGVGMSEEVASHILEREGSSSSAFFKEIGVSNVHKRLQYEFGSSYGLHITSTPGEFTTVSIQLPYRTEQGENT